LSKKYGNDLRIVFKHNPLPFHQNAMPAANATECAREQGKFWEMHDMIFENPQALTPADFEGHAGKIGLDVGRYKSCYSANKYKARIEADQKTAAALGARGTPAFFINGRFLSGAQPVENFARLVDEELKKAKASGMSKGEYYDKAVVGKGKKSI